MGLGKLTGYGKLIAPAILLGCSIVSEAAQDKLEVWGVLENFQVAFSDKEGLRNRLSWIEVNARYGHWKGTASYLDVPLDFRVKRSLDEAFIAYECENITAKAGRLRSPFGLYTWSDLFYTPIIAFPLVRMLPMTPKVGLLRQDTGFEVSGGSPELQYQVALVDVKNDDWQVAPKKLDHVVARGQVYVGNFIIGASAMTKIKGDATGSQVAGIDVRWTTPRWIARGEYVKGFGKGLNSSGYYLEVFYRPEKMPKTQIGLRTEAFKMLGSQDEGRLHHVGVRQVLNQHITLSANYRWANKVAPVRTMQGWSFQIMSRYRFRERRS